MEELVALDKSISYYTEKINANKNQPCLSIYYILRSVLYESLGKFQESLRDALATIQIDGAFWKGHHQALKMYIKFENIYEAGRISEKFKNDDEFDALRRELDALKRRRQENEVTTEYSMRSTHYPFKAGVGRIQKAQKVTKSSENHHENQRTPETTLIQSAVAVRTEQQNRGHRQIRVRDRRRGSVDELYARPHNRTTRCPCIIL